MYEQVKKLFDLVKHKGQSWMLVLTRGTCDNSIRLLFVDNAIAVNVAKFQGTGGWVGGWVAEKN